MHTLTVSNLRGLTWSCILGLVVFLLTATASTASGIDPFIGTYHGSAEVVNADGSKSPRDMSVEIVETGDGFNVSWRTISYKTDGRVKESAYSVDFLPTSRDGIFSAAMKRNVFGHAVQLDPMKGEPFVWGRIIGDTLTVFSLFVDANGGYEMQQFDRTLAENGLVLEFSRLSNGEKAKSVQTFLEKE
ncbi:hypothetical protein DS909_17595 [Phaeobacter gallaeciensis]|uniref:Uncharacterized protein n=2 Tax=Roseobacteraceae TaxID=2854170 RepID=A0A366WQN3_9RHOB|nr:MULTISPECIES: hypothetical protein [Roseobacteraceae]MBT3140367.1 hypothetical protein [Falsiruegeria litorea]MBT8171152.1 hypothetical protein [Falsiruegeria litorea]RBW51746.1 hypothetical protein DS909_17595 [Phaeobacter gallaeciensis]